LRADWQLPVLDVRAGVQLRRPRPGDIEHLAANLRAADREELYACSGTRDYLSLLAYSVAQSEHVLVGCTPDGEPGAAFGVTTVSLLSNIGCPWMLGTERAGLFKRSLVAGGRAYTAAMLQQYARLENLVDARNTAAVAWLRRCGYTIGSARPHGPLGLPFHHFRIERTHV
jgi:hypothetical protein